MPMAATVGSNPYNVGWYFVSDVMIGSDRFVHGLPIIGARSPAFASAQMLIGWLHPGAVLITSGPFPAASSVVSS